MATSTTGKNDSIVVSALHARANFGKLLNRVDFECADAVRADYLITGNRRHFPAFWKGTKVIASREFISLAAPHLQK
jgi:hypothetical protein